MYNWARVTASRSGLVLSSCVSIAASGRGLLSSRIKPCLRRLFADVSYACDLEPLVQYWPRLCLIPVAEADRDCGREVVSFLLGHLVLLGRIVLVSVFPLLGRVSLPDRRPMVLVERREIIEGAGPVVGACSVVVQRVRCPGSSRLSRSVRGDACVARDILLFRLVVCVFGIES